MATLHVFNPEHDIALAADLDTFTAPKAGRELRHDLGWLPVFWAEAGDYVLVENVDAAVRSVTTIPLRLPHDVNFVRSSAFSQKALLAINRVVPWGWDRALAGQLRRLGLSSVLPSSHSLEQLRLMSHRHFAARHFLSRLRTSDERLVGEATLVHQLSDLSFSQSPQERPFVLKAPWSSSGRGVRFVTDAQSFHRNLQWAQNVINRQGGIMVEPLYERVRDFGMEFYVDGQTSYLGLSLFETVNGAYIGNILASEEEKREELSKEIPLSLLDRVCSAIISIADECLAPFYSGPFGIDMMVVKTTDGVLKLHPCVELNLRRTMGHVALDVSRCDVRRTYALMSIRYDGTYSFHLS